MTEWVDQIEAKPGAWLADVEWDDPAISHGELAYLMYVVTGRLKAAEEKLVEVGGPIRLTIVPENDDDG